MNFLKPMIVFDAVTSLDLNVITRTGTASNLIPFPIKLASSYQGEVPAVAQGALSGKRLSDSSVRELLQEFENPLNERTFGRQNLCPIIARQQSIKQTSAEHARLQKILKVTGQRNLFGSFHPHHAHRHTARQKTTDTSGSSVA